MVFFGYVAAAEVYSETPLNLSKYPLPEKVYSGWTIWAARG
jgi:hypothetical protein